MKATDIKDKTSSHSSQNLRGRTLIFLAIYVLETCGPVAPHCACMTDSMYLHTLYLLRQKFLGCISIPTLQYPVITYPYIYVDCHYISTVAYPYS